eukprot:2418805-Ditylum_brightwellii.AAC.1
MAKNPTSKSLTTRHPSSCSQTSRTRKSSTNWHHPTVTAATQLKRPFKPLKTISLLVYAALCPLFRLQCGTNSSYKPSSHLIYCTSCSLTPDYQHMHSWMMHLTSIGLPWHHQTPR